MSYIRQRSHLSKEGILRVFQERSALVRELSNAKQGVLYYISFKRLDTLNILRGHRYVDEWLESVAFELLDYINGRAKLFRLAKNELVIVYPFHSKESYFTYANAIREIIGQQKQELAIGIHIGITPFEQFQYEPQELIRKGYFAMRFNLVTDTPQPFHVFEETLWEHYEQRLLLEKDLRVALNQNELYVAYQPIVHLESDQIGFEALARWESPTHGNVPPSVFIPLAEESGMIQEITRFVLMNVQRQLLSYPTIDYMTVNLSSKLFDKPDWYEHLKDAFNQIPNSKIYFELTESFSIKKNNHGYAAKLQKRGHKVFIDDFGTGYSSLVYLVNLEVNGIKLDRSFVNYVEDEEYQPFILKIVEMAKSLGLSMIIEGIENKVQKEFFESIGCDGIQGYLEAKPMNSGELAQYWDRKQQINNRQK